MIIGGNVGIGTSTPSHALNVVGDANITGDLYVNSSTVFIGNVSLSNLDGVLVWGNVSIGNPVDTNAVVAFNQEECPLGWALADGQDGRPDLRGIFIRGAGTSGVYAMANGTNYSAGQGEFGNDSFQGHYHTWYRSSLTAADVGGLSYRLDGTTSTLGGDHVKEATTDGINGPPRTGGETAPASIALIYCVKTGEDSSASNSIWQSVGNVIGLANSSKSLSIEADVNITGNLYVDGSLIGGGECAEKFCCGV